MNKLNYLHTIFVITDIVRLTALLIWPRQSPGLTLSQCAVCLSAPHKLSDEV